MENALLFIILIFGICLNLYLFNKIKKNIVEKENTEILDIKLKLLESKISDTNDYLVEINKKIEDLENREIPVNDEFSAYDKGEENINEIAKKMNKSVREVELLLKMRGLNK